MKVHDVADVTVHEAFVYEPESVPLVHMRDCETHWLPEATDDDWYAVTEEPFVIVWPLKVQDVGVPTLQDAAVYEPERVPLEHVRVSETHDDPYATEDD